MSTELQISYFKRTSSNSNNFYQHILHIKKYTFLGALIFARDLLTAQSEDVFSHTHEILQSSTFEKPIQPLTL